MSDAQTPDEPTGQDWIDSVMRAHEDVVRDAVNAALTESATEREKRESAAFMRGMLVGSFVGIVMWVLILLAVFAVFVG